MLTGIFGEWSDLGNQRQYRTEDGAILNWWETTRTILFQGNDLAAKELEAALSSAISTGRGTIAAEAFRAGMLREPRKEIATLKQRISDLENENAMLKKRPASD